MKKIVFIMFIAASFIACNNKKSAQWPEAEKKTFTDQCVKGASGTMGEEKAKSYCSCMLAKVEAKYPNSNDATKLDVATTMEMAKDCAK